VQVGAGCRQWASYRINRSNLLVLESKADMQKRGQASPDDGDALALTFAQAVAAAEVEEDRTRRAVWPFARYGRRTLLNY
jgi:hypothetical protein